MISEVKRFINHDGFLTWLTLEIENAEVNYGIYIDSNLYTGLATEFLNNYPDKFSELVEIFMSTQALTWEESETLCTVCEEDERRIIEILRKCQD